MPTGFLLFDNIHIRISSIETLYINENRILLVLNTGKKYWENFTDETNENGYPANTNAEIRFAEICRIIENQT